MKWPANSIQSQFIILNPVFGHWLWASIIFYSPQKLAEEELDISQKPLDDIRLVNS